MLEKGAPDEYRGKAENLAEQIAFLSVEIKKRQEELGFIEDENRKIDEDMKKIIRYSYMEELTEELLDAFVKKMYVYKDKSMVIEWNFADGCRM
ncbi:MAG: DUF4368 domain-containing protein [Lachnospiraceae bacterium]|nr:DUF4368 domain-containing protein [Lachnospiraceae bacterium]